MSRNDLRISGSDLRKLEQAGQRLKSVESRINADKIASIAASISSSVAAVMQRIDKIERFFKIERGGETSQKLHQGLEAAQGLAAGVEKGLYVGVMTGNPALGVGVAIVGGTAGLVLGATQRGRRQDVAILEQQQENVRFGFDQQREAARQHANQQRFSEQQRDDVRGQLAERDQEVAQAAQEVATREAARRRARLVR